VEPESENIQDKNEQEESIGNNQENGEALKELPETYILAM
jgi:hypothetical protein